MPNFFTKNTPAGRTITPSPKSKLQGPEVPIAGLAILTKMKAVIDALTAVCATRESEVKTGPVMDHFLAQGLQRGDRPANFKAREDSASASFQLKQRSSVSVLTDGQVGDCRCRGMRVDDLAGVPLSFPTYAGILVNAAASAARQLGLTVTWQAHVAA
jgi:hypothetical protein